MALRAQLLLGEGDGAIATLSAALRSSGAWLSRFHERGQETTALGMRALLAGSKGDRALAEPDIAALDGRAAVLAVLAALGRADEARGA